MGKRLLILTAGMGAGHDAVAAELARRMARRDVETSVVDVLDLLPLRLGHGMRRMYEEMVRSAPWLYEGIYQAFFVSRRPPPSSPLTELLANRLDARMRELPPDAVVSTFHIAAQATGRLRDSGRLIVPSVVLVTDFAVHRMWLHAGNDRYLCPDDRAARTVMERTGRPASGHAPVVRPEFRRRRVPGSVLRDAAGARPDDRIVLISAGAWGVGRVEETAQGLAASGRYVPVVLCGRNERLRERVYGPALGWRDDMPKLMAGAYALIDNAAGLTCREAFACGLPVISYRPIPGHGRDGAAAMESAGLSCYARTPGELIRALDRLKDEAARRVRARRAAALFDAVPAERVIGSVLG
ncbi:MGDG synthase family glycosyltransferase [Actinomadura chokoriensis]|uniref:Diacylglycerol glucosyltransferase N-terminal domain-containing protein n=1 Tax=Actinomadura chokoriensis TaxID=454156 RepID=A0ABV4QP54_9ACTN